MKWKNNLKDGFPDDEEAIYLIKYDHDFFLGYYFSGMDSILCFGCDDEQIGLCRGADFEYADIDLVDLVLQDKEQTA